MVRRIAGTHPDRNDKKTMHLECDVVPSGRLSHLVAPPLKEMAC